MKRPKLYGDKGAVKSRKEGNYIQDKVDDMDIPKKTGKKKIKAKGKK